MVESQGRSRKSPRRQVQAALRDFYQLVSDKEAILTKSVWSSASELWNDRDQLELLERMYPGGVKVAHEAFADKVVCTATTNIV